MHILLTSAASPLTQALATLLQPEHTIRLTERIFVPNLPELAVCTLHHDHSTNLLLCGLDAIVHVAEPLPTDNEGQQIDYLTRGTYNLCMAAVAEGVKRIVYLSTLHLMTQYDENLRVGERWRPRPTTAAPVLAKHLGEQVCREFAREHKLSIAVLRLGRVVQTEEMAGWPFDPLWLDERDAVQAIARALTADVGDWSVFHVSADAPDARFSVEKAKKTLGYAPVYNFQPD
ncbi:MAG: NAD(P)-dependent oxidoreductase [Chloroflexota bacterium]|nr:NAD(P)-dependent oxidoreductase [Chloroflexota bacterium]